MAGSEARYEGLVQMQRQIQGGAEGNKEGILVDYQGGGKDQMEEQSQQSSTLASSLTTAMEAAKTREKTSMIMK